MEHPTRTNLGPAAAEALTLTWRKRVLWMAIAALGFSLWKDLFTCFVGIFPDGNLTVPAYLEISAPYLIPVGVVILLVRGRLVPLYTLKADLWISRWRFAMGSVLLMFLLHVCQTWEFHQLRILLSGPWIQSSMLICIWPLTLVALIVWLLPRQNQISKPDQPDGFDLNAALGRWRREFAFQSHLTPEDQRELESHLYESMAELRRIGLSDEEAFQRARQGLGQIQSLATELFKADPSKVWREWTFWGTIGLIAVSFWQSVSILLWAACKTANQKYFFTPVFPARFRFYLPEDVSDLLALPMYILDHNLYLLPLACMAFCLTREQFVQKFSRFQIRSRHGFCLISAIFIPSCTGLVMAGYFGYAERVLRWFFIGSLIQLIFFVFSLLVIAWLLPAYNTNRTLGKG